jgi:glutamate synthase domain-containing protein 3
MSDNAINKIVKIDTEGLNYRQLNIRLRELTANGTDRIELYNVCGQRYIGTDLNRAVEIEIFGTPGNDLGAFMDKPRIAVHGNAQDGCGNTMNSGEIIVHGHAGDITGLSARGGSIFIRDDVGYRAGIHMKGYEDKKPTLVIGGTAQDFVGEYMAGGIMVLLGLTLKDGEQHRARFIGTGMHGGVIYIRGDIDDYQLGKEVGRAELDDEDNKLLEQLVARYADYFNLKTEEIMNKGFIKLFPRWLRPYGQLYAY